MRTREKSRDYMRARYRRRNPAKQKHPAHACGLCSQPGHNARTCKACSRCGRAEGQWATSQGRLCQACLVEVAA